MEDTRKDEKRIYSQQQFISVTIVVVVTAKRRIVVFQTVLSTNFILQKIIKALKNN